ncbi:hypothetical protein ACVIOG_001223 [Rhizobium leguminosarum]
MGEAVELILDRCDDPGMAVAGVENGDAGGEIDVAAALLVPDLRILCAIRIDLCRHADAA